MLKEATQEICRVLMFLGHSEVTLRRDTEPAMKQLSDAVKLTRTRLGLTTHIEDAGHFDKQAVCSIDSRQH